MARILAPTPENLALAAEALKRGEVVGMPTETVYGLAGNALDPLALARIFETKERPTFDPLILHVGLAARGLRALENLKLVDPQALSPEARARAEALMQAFWPGPLTLVLPKTALVPDLATSGLPTVALRMPRHPLAQALIALAGTPLAAPSANRFGRISPTSAADVAEELGDRIDWIVDGGACEIGLESTVVAIGEDGTLSLLRPGGTPAAEIERTAGVRLAPPAPPPGGGKHTGPQSAPGMLESHYAPRKPMRLLPGPVDSLADAAALAIAPTVSHLGLLVAAGDAKAKGAAFSKLTGLPVTARTLSRTGDPREAAQRLFAEMRHLDGSQAELIFAEPCAIDQGLGHAISDRLRRACATRA